ncbi:MAG: ribonuclease E/G, partial [Deltaproteobacteria bacterium]|nr:ribonuclease E/G [Deltaproteobacteria bacterium]
MANELIVNVTLGETRIARLENGVVAEMHVERAREVGIVGNIYKGKVVRVLPGMQAAFMELGLERTGFLHASDVAPPPSEGEVALPVQLTEGEEEDAGETDEDAAEEPGEAEEKNAKAPARRPRRRQFREPLIQDAVKEGQELLVQVTKEPIGTKGARLSSYISLPGRYLVYMPTVNHIGTSRRIDGEKERHRLRDIVEKHRPRGAGFIIRTASEGVNQRDLRADITYLTKLWEEIAAKAPRLKA